MGSSGFHGIWFEVNFVLERIEFSSDFEKKKKASIILRHFLTSAVTNHQLNFDIYEVELLVQFSQSNSCFSDI